MESLYNWLEALPVSTFIRESNSLWAFPMFLFAHTLGMSIVAGGSSLIDMALLGFWPRALPVKPLERLAANTYGASIADAMIAKMLTEENLTRLLKTGAITSGDASSANMLRLTELDTSKLSELLSRLVLVKPVEFSIRLGDTESAGGVSMHFEGNGWRLSGIQLPTASVQVLAQSLVDGRGRKS